MGYLSRKTRRRRMKKSGKSRQDVHMVFNKFKKESPPNGCIIICGVPEGAVDS